MLDEVDGACGTCGRYRNSYRNLNLNERGHLGDAGIDGRIILKLTLKKRGLDDGDRIRLVQLGKVAGFCEHGNEPNDLIKRRIS